MEKRDYTLPDLSSLELSENDLNSISIESALVTSTSAEDYDFGFPENTSITVTTTSTDAANILTQVIKNKFNLR